MSTTANQLAIDGGIPVRDTNRQPWPQWPVTGEAEWKEEIEPAFRAVYEYGVEGRGGTVGAALGREFADYCGTAHGRLLPHGTDAIMAALAAALDLGVWGRGPEVIVPNYTYIATASAPLDRACPVVFVDIDPRTFTLDPEAVEAAIVPGRTGAILPVHLAGHPADMEALNAIARRHGLVVIEDCAQAHGARCGGKSVGSLGHAGAFSFQSSKNMTSGEGGLVTTDDTGIDNRVAAFMDSGRMPEGARWDYPRVGWNYRPSEYVAALLRVRLRKLEEQTEHRRRMADCLSSRLAEVPGVTPPQNASWCARHAYHLYCMLLDTEAFGGRSRDEIVRAVQAEGVPCVAGYQQPLSEQPALKQLRERHPESHRVEPCPNTESACDRSLWLTQNVLLAGESDMDQVAEALAKVRAAFA